MKHASWLLALMILIIGSGSIFADDNDEDAGRIGPNIAITITIVDTEDDNSRNVRTYRLLARDGATGSRLLMGWRTPIPSGRTAGKDPDEQPVTSYVYQNIGVTSRLMPMILDDGRILLQGEIEISGVRENDPMAQGTPNVPIIGTFQQALNVLLEEGKTLRVAEVPDPEGGTLALELKADVLD